MFKLSKFNYLFLTAPNTTYPPYVNYFIYTPHKTSALENVRGSPVKVPPAMMKLR